MKLFNDTDLFATGTRGTREFDLPDADIMLIDNFFSKEESDDFYDKLLTETQWREYEMPMYDKIVTAPRMISWHQDKKDGIPSGNAPEFTADLNKIRQRVETQIGLKFNAVLLNLYRNGNDGVSWHSDKIDKSGINPIIASVTFGETRMFRLRHKFRKDVPQLEIPLYHGSFLTMAGKTNSFWEHAVPKTAKEVLPRINLTFRRVIR
ncbi:alpha-ketoglutarate-dependent dioxygenase AlkB [Paenimyroides baculatum]|uniref:Alpha-ketoglutarate-dependent dioxygenase AlkB n=2 Tax=Paenimyroides baculatum TaxID=2608000 RepID=A0A5M6C9F3_9FLAO|nr:alpha-ketoglutarate-dependent dioxygenase AlkB [Paenimyroides baculatum]